MTHFSPYDRLEFFRSIVIDIKDQADAMSEQTKIDITDDMMKIVAQLDNLADRVECELKFGPISPVNLAVLH